MKKRTLLVTGYLIIFLSAWIHAEKHSILVAVPIPQDVVNLLYPTQQQLTILDQLIGKAKSFGTTRQELHITLVYFDDEVTDRELQKVIDALSFAANVIYNNFYQTHQGINVSNAQVIDFIGNTGWIALYLQSRDLGRAAKIITQAFDLYGVPYSSKEFSAHTSLGKIGRKVTDPKNNNKHNILLYDLLIEHAYAIRNKTGSRLTNIRNAFKNLLVPSFRFQVRSFVLYESRPGGLQVIRVFPVNIYSQLQY